MVNTTLTTRGLDLGRISPVGKQSYLRRRLQGCRSLSNRVSTPTAFTEKRRHRGESLGAQRYRHHDKAGFPSPGLIYNVNFWERGEKGRGRVVGFKCRSHPFAIGVAGERVVSPVENNVDFFEWQCLHFLLKTPFLFKLHSPQNFFGIVGLFVRHSFLQATLAWDSFGEKNGAADFLIKN